MTVYIYTLQDVVGDNLARNRREAGKVTAKAAARLTKVKVQPIKKAPIPFGSRYTDKKG